LHVTIASNERFFPLKFIKTYLRLTIENDRLSDLLVIAVESDIAAKISLEDTVDVFSKIKIEDIHLQLRLI
jgi:hypothetical protein